MAGTFNLQIVTPEREVFNHDVQSVRLPGMNGSFGVLRNHAPLIAALEPGEVDVIDNDSNEHIFAIGGGFFQVSSNQAILLADSAAEPGAIDLAREEEIEREARERLAEQLGPGFEKEREAAEKALKGAQARRRIATRRGPSLT
jgi:F-type H+-transporting ATPase subunit epsilon